MRTFYSILGCCTLLAACGSPARPLATAPIASSSTVPASTVRATDALDAPLPLDGRITAGKLDNGLRYFVLPHGKPEKRAQLWLAVNAGSVLEDDDQRGLAHFTEHMSFNATRRFPKRELIDFFEKSGIRFGADLNASTSFDETVYTLQVPTDRPELLDRAFQVLRDWADGVTFEPADMERERGVLLEEWRLGRGAGMRLLDKQAPVLFAGSKYAERLPIGRPEIIKGASRETLVRYYRDWYRPDLMAVIAVGDFRATDIEGRIKGEFAGLQAHGEKAPRPSVTMPPHQQTQVSIETDPELPFTSVSVLSNLPHRPEASTRDQRRNFAEQLFHSMLNARLEELLHQPDAPFLSASSASTKLARAADTFGQSARVKEGGIERGLGALLEEVLRVERHGFTASEFDRAKRKLLRQYQEAAKERDKRDGREYAAELVRHYLRGEAAPGREAELALLQRFLPTFTLEEVSSVGKGLSAGSRVILVTGPATMTKPTAEALLALDKAVAARAIEPYQDGEAGVALMVEAPKPGAVVASSAIADIGVTEWKLKNGVRVIVKPTDFSNDEVRVTAFSPGGHSRVKDADFASAKFADAVVSEGGLGPFDAVKLRKFLADKVVALRPFITDLEEGVEGRAAPADLELMFQMIYLSMTAPRRDEAAFLAWRGRETEAVQNRRLSPEVSFFEQMAAFSSQDHLRRRPTTPEQLASIDLDTAMATYRDRFADAGDFTFVVVGNVELPRLQPLVETFLGSLPSKRRKETWRDVGVSWPPGVKTKNVVQGSEPKSLVSLHFHGAERWSLEAEGDLRALVDVLRIRLREVLRDDLGSVYRVQVGGGISRRPRQEYGVNVSFGCSPENVDKLEQAVFDVIKSLQANGIGDDYIGKVKEGRRRTHEVELKDNGYWQRELVRAYDLGDDPRLIPDITPTLSRLTAGRVRAAANRYLSSKQYVLGVLKPETTVAPSPASKP